MTRLREDIFPCAKAKKGNKKTLLRREGSFATSPFALTGGFSFFLTLNAGLFIMLAFTHFLENAAAGALPLKPFERTFQGLIFADTNLGHLLSLPSLNTMACGIKENRKPYVIIQPLTGIVNFFSGKRFSGHLFRHLPAAENMEMQVMDRLAGIVAAVGNDAVSAGQVFLSGNNANGTQAFRQFGIRGSGGIIQGAYMLLRNHQDVDRRLRINITERIDIFILIDFLRGNLTADDFAEETIFHNVHHPFHSDSFISSPHMTREPAFRSLTRTGTPDRQSPCSRRTRMYSGV